MDKYPIAFAIIVYLMHLRTVIPRFVGVAELNERAIREIVPNPEVIESSVIGVVDVCTDFGANTQVKSR